MLYSDFLKKKYSAKTKNDIVMVEGVPPLTLLNCKNSRLYDYTVYGNVGGVGNLQNEDYIIPVIVRGKNYFSFDKSSTSPYFTISKVENKEKWAVKRVGTAGADLLALQCNLEIGTSIKMTIPEITSDVPDSAVDKNRSFRLRVKYSDGTFGYPNSNTLLIVNKPCTEILCQLNNTNNTNWQIGETLTFSNPILEIGEITGIYEPYVEPVTYDVVLNNPLYVDDFIDYHRQIISRNGIETQLNLPPIFTNQGTTILTVGTEIQPSNTIATYFKK